MSNKLTKEEFLEKLKTDRDFNSRYGRKHITEGKMVLPPCHYGFQVYTRELSQEERFKYGVDVLGYLGMLDFGDHQLNDMVEFMNIHNIPTRAISLMWNQRSVDTFLGLPFNIASYGLLLELIAKAVNMVPDELIGNLGDTHLYLNHIEQAEEQINRTSFPLPKLNINTEFWPTEGGSCGEGPLDAIKVFESFKDDNFCKCLLEEDIQLSNYQSHPTIKAPLSN
jgi:thymidylate synthase